MTILAAVHPHDASYILVLREAANLAGDKAFEVLHMHPSVGADESYVSPAERTAKTREAMKRQIEEDLRAHSLNATVSVPVARTYDLGDNIVEHARKVGASVIVIGTHGRTGVSRLFLGSVAERVVRQAHCHVYVARPPRRGAR